MKDKIGQIAEKYLEDLDRSDELLRMAVELLLEFEYERTKSNFNIDDFEAHVKQKFELDDTCLILFERALSRMRRAISYTEENEGKSDDLLKRSKLNLDQYDGISAEIDPKFPGVIVIKIQSSRDAGQFDSDIESDVEKRLRTMFGGDGIDVSIVGEDRKGTFIGKSVDPKSVGFGEDVPLLSVIVVVMDIEEELRGQVLRHEYDHAVFAGILEKVIHEKLSAFGIDQNSYLHKLEKLIPKIREKIVAALGDISTFSLDESKKSLDFGSDDHMRALEEVYGVGSVMSREDSYAMEMDRVVSLEQKLMNEMRAYANNGLIWPPNFPYVAEKFERSPYEGCLGYIDEKMLKRFYELHTLMLKALFLSDEMLGKALSVLGVAQSLSQAKRMIQHYMNRMAFEASADENSFKDFVFFTAKFGRGEVSHVIKYDISGEPVLEDKEALKMMLPPYDYFKMGVQRFFGGVMDEDCAFLDKFYRENC
jgi:hypothetical protein